VANRESSGGKRLYGYKNGKAISFGRYQIRPQTASNIEGYTVTAAQLLHDNFSRKVFHDILYQDLQLAHGDIKGALAWYNGGHVSYETYRKTGQNEYAEKVLAGI
jgi:hypothetical protein